MLEIDTFWWTSFIKENQKNFCWSNFKQLMCSYTTQNFFAVNIPIFGFW